MADRQPNEQSSSPPDWQQIIDQRLARLPGALRQPLETAAIPRWVTPGLLQAMLADDSLDVVEVLDGLVRAGWLTEEQPGKFVMPVSLRGPLLQQLRVTPALRTVSRRAAEYFAMAGSQADAPAEESIGNQIEEVYHLLAADEALGRSRLYGLFETLRQNRELGPAERLLDAAQEQEPVLQGATKEWLRYLSSALQQALGHQDDQEAIYTELAENAEDPRLRGVARRSLGTLLADSRRWSDAINQFQMAADWFESQAQTCEAARTRAALGVSFVKLAETSGGLRPEQTNQGWWLSRLSFAPFLLYLWFSRRFRFIPNLYFGVDYQNWIVTRFLLGALMALEEAVAGFRACPDEHGAVEALSVRIRLADLRHRVGRWRQAEREFAALQKDPQVQASPYLQALIQFGLGRAYLVRNQSAAAVQRLETAVSYFVGSGNLPVAAEALRLLSTAHTQLGATAVALERMLAAARLFHQHRDFLSATECLIAAEGIASADTADLGGSIPSLRALKAALQPQMHVARFPAAVQATFQKLAIFVAMPLTYLFARTFADSVDWLLSLVIFVVSALGRGVHPLATDSIMAALLLALFPLLIVWLYHALYGITGSIYVRLAPVSAFLQAERRYYVDDAEGFAVYDEESTLIDWIPWTDIGQLISLDRSFWQEPSDLFSRFQVVAATDQGNAHGSYPVNLVVDGIVNGYLYLKKKVLARLPAGAETVVLDFRVYDRRWLWLTGFATLAMATVAFTDVLDRDNPTLYYISQPTPSGEIIRMYLSGFLSSFLRWTVNLWPLFLLGRLLWNRRRIRQTVDNLLPIGGGRIVWAGFLFMVALNLVQLYLLTE